MSWFQHFWYYWRLRVHYVAGGNLPFFRACLMACDRVVHQNELRYHRSNVAWGGERDDY